MTQEYGVVVAATCEANWGCQEGYLILFPCVLHSNSQNPATYLSWTEVKILLSPSYRHTYTLNLQHKGYNKNCGEVCPAVDTAPGNPGK